VLAQERGVLRSGPHWRPDRKADAPLRRLAHGPAPPISARACGSGLIHFAPRGSPRIAGGTLENAQPMAAYETPRTTKLYDRTGDDYARRGRADRDL